MLRRIALVGLLATCGDPELGVKQAGETCSASSECAAALLCDLAKHQCAGKGTIDAAQPIDAPEQPVVDAAVDSPVPPADAPPDAPPD